MTGGSKPRIAGGVAGVLVMLLAVWSARWWVVPLVAIHHEGVVHHTSVAAMQDGDYIAMRGYYDVKGWPVADPERWECDEARLVRVDVGKGAIAGEEPKETP